MEIIQFTDFIPFHLAEFEPLKLKQGVRKKGDKIPCINCISAFDIETSHEPFEYEEVHHRPGTKVAIKQGTVEKKLIPPVSWMYHWQWAFGDKYLVTGRTWEEFREMLRYIRLYMTRGEAKLVVYVHNLSYEFQYLRGIYDFDSTEVFAVKSRRVLKCTMDGEIEFRCSALLTNMSLEAFTDKYNCPHKKATGDLDHNITRYPFTPLTPEELSYCYNDVWGLVEAVTAQMKLYGDTLYTIPLTSTGYVRREAKDAMRRARVGMIDEIKPDAEVYVMLREAFRGGNTHANRYFVQDYDAISDWDFDAEPESKILHNVHSADRSSSYPDVIVNCEFPISKFKAVEHPTLNRIVNLIDNCHKAVLFKIAFKNLELKDTRNPCPYIPLAKCLEISQRYVIDNGRILSCDYAIMSVTDIDFKIIRSQYKFSKTDVYIFSAYEASYGPLPPSFVDLVVKYYVEKTKLKNIEGQELFYEKFKNLINALYGMMAQDPGKPHFLYDANSDDVFVKDNSDKLTIFEEGNEKAFLPYQWGVWVTAWARLRLQEGIDLAGHNFVYCDTDSVKYLGEIDFTDYNNARIKDSVRNGAFGKDSEGKTHYMGAFEDEGVYTSFATMGAKKYVYIPAQGKHAGELCVTIAGVNKKKGGKELEKHGGITAFKYGFEFVEAGGTDLVYIDRQTSRWKVVTMDNGLPYFIELTPSVTIINSTYKLGLSEDFRELLDQIADPRDTETIIMD